MQKLFVIAVMLGVLGAGGALADTYVNGYTRSDGTYVQGHYRSEADGNPYNNYSTRGNVNPYTGRVGTKDPSGLTGYGNGSGSGGLYDSDLDSGSGLYGNNSLSGRR